MKKQGMLGQMIKIKGSKICNAAIILLQLSNIVFAAGWLRGIWVLIYMILTCVGTVYACLIIGKEMKDCLNISIKALMVLAIGVGVLVWICGIGGYFPQGGDWVARNAIYRDLLNYDWPIVYSETGYGLCYYIGFWLPPACIAKLLKQFGYGEWILWNVGNALLYLWSCVCLLGVFFLLLLKVYRNKKIGVKAVILSMTVFICWGGGSILGEKIAETWGIADSGRLNSFYIEHWSKNVTIMNSNITMMMNVFNQLIPAWIATMLFLNLFKHYELFGVIGFSIFISAPFPMVGLGILLFGAFIREAYVKRKLNLWKLFSLSNLCSLAMLVVGVLYFQGNNSSITIRNILEPTGSIPPILWLLIVFLLTFGGWAIVLFIIKRDRFIIFITLSLMLISIISIGGTVDFAMRASIPGEIILMCYVLECLNKRKGLGLEEKAREIIPIMLTISFMAVWICFMNICGLAVEANTLKRPTDTVAFYSLEGHTDEYDLPILNQYTIRNVNENLFFYRLCGVGSDCIYPVIEKIVDKATGELRIESVTMQLSQSEHFLSLIAEVDKPYAVNQINMQLGGNNSIGRVVFQEALAVDRHAVVENYDLDVEWLDYSDSIQMSGGERLVHIRITNNSEKTFAFSELEEDKLGIGIYAKLTDLSGKIYFPISLRKINRFMFPGESVSLSMAIPANAVEKRGEYVLEFGVYQKTESTEGVASKLYETTQSRQYLIEYK